MLIKTTTSAGSRKKVIVLGIDGTPYSFLRNEITAGAYSNFGRLIDGGSFREIHSVYPPVSSVAWTSFMTGKNPGEHGIFGFLDRRTMPFGAFVPNSTDIKAPVLWDILGNAGKKVLVINVPVTYPPHKVNGVLVSGFLGSDIKKSVTPEQYIPYLETAGYRIDINPWKAREDIDYFIRELNLTLTKRLETALYLYEKIRPDFFMLHIMGTDRLHHFMWDYYEQKDGQYYDEFVRFHSRVDNAIGAVSSLCDDDTELIILSDHGFCRLEKEININTILHQAGYLKFRTENPETPVDIHPQSKAYSFVPGRIYINLNGREQFGSVRPGTEYEELRGNLKSLLLSFSDPDSGRQVISDVFYPEEIYSGPCMGGAPDLVCNPVDGFDLKGNLNRTVLTERSKILGMHTYTNAALFVKNSPIPAGVSGIQDVFGLVLREMNMEI